MQEPADQKKKTSWRTRVLAAASGLVAAGVSLGYSVYEQRIDRIIPQVAVATPVAAGRWTVAILEGSVSSTLPNGLSVPPDKKAIAVDMKLENVSSESSNLYGDLVVLANVAGAPEPQYYLLRDRAILWDLQPRMAEHVTAVWEVPLEQALPANLQLSIAGDLFKPRDNLYAAPGWFPSGIVAQIDLPLSDKMAGAER